MSRPPRKLIFHVGHHKAGSTSIQDTLAAGSIEVDGQKPLYPARMTHNYLCKHVDAYAKDQIIFKGSAGKPNLKKIAQLLENKDYTYAVISGEEFEGVSSQAVMTVMEKFLLPHVDQHTVLCCRRVPGYRDGAFRYNDPASLRRQDSQ